MFACISTPTFNLPANWLLFLGIPALVASAWAIAKAIAGASDEPFAQRGYVLSN